MVLLAIESNHFFIFHRFRHITTMRIGRKSRTTHYTPHTQFTDF